MASLTLANMDEEHLAKSLKLMDQMYPPFRDQAPNTYDVVHSTAQQESVGIMYENHMNDDGLLIIGEPGAGKTMAILNIIKTYLGDLDRNKMEKKVYILSYNHQVFIDQINEYLELSMFADFPFLDKIADPNTKQLTLQSCKRYLHFIGYIGLGTDLFNTTEKKDILGSHQYWDHSTEATLLEAGIKVNNANINKYEGALIIADEAHNAYRHKEMNFAGLGFSLLQSRLNSIQVILTTATPLMTYETEVIILANILLRAKYQFSDFYLSSDTKTVEKPLLNEVLKMIGKKTLIISPPKGELPSLLFEGNKLPEINSKFNYIPVHMTASQIKEHSATERRDDKFIIETCGVKDHTFLLSKSGGQALNNTYPTLDSLFASSGKVRKLDELLFDPEDGLVYKPGQIVIYVSYKVFPGSALLEHYFQLKGAVLFGSKRGGVKWCMKCRGLHRGDHPVEPVNFAHLNKGISKPIFDNNFKEFNSHDNEKFSLPMQIQF